MQKEIEIRWCQLCDTPITMTAALTPIAPHRGLRGAQLFTDGKLVHILLSPKRTAIRMRSIERKKQTTYIVRLVEQVLESNPAPTTAELVEAINTPAEQV
jgi:hypothetical protein